MNGSMNAIAAVDAVYTVLVAVVSYFVFYKIGYKHGARDRNVSLLQAYELGRKSGDNWWLGVEAEIEQERRRIWEKEKGKKRA
jgi:hypothetical protein